MDIKENANQNKTIAFDFDGVIHKYSKGWTGETDIYDEPVDGMKDLIDELRSLGYKIAVISSRARFLEGLKAIEIWLIEHDIEVDWVTSQKCPAICYIDDRAIRFTGDVETLMLELARFMRSDEAHLTTDDESKAVIDESHSKTWFESTGRTFYF